MKKHFVTLLILVIPIISFTQNWSEIIKVVASDRFTGDEYGIDVSMHESFAIVGADRHDNDEAGMNFMDGAGCVYILKNVSGTWQEVQKIVATDRESWDMFGQSVDIFGNYAIVGAFLGSENATGGDSIFQAGAAYIFENVAGVWTETEKIVASDRSIGDFFGLNVAISNDWAVVGTTFESEDTAGLNTLPNAGAVYMFRNSSGSWAETQKIVSPDREVDGNFGASVAINNGYLLVGAARESYDDTTGGFLLTAGAAYLFKDSANIWVFVQKLVASDRGYWDQFGTSVALSDNYAVVGAPFEDHNSLGNDSLDEAGSAYVYGDSSGVWVEVNKLTPADRGEVDHFGSSLDISGNSIIVGAMHEDEDENSANSMNRAGSAYIFKYNNINWVEDQKIVASDRWTMDWFGYRVGISDGFAICSALLEDHDTVGGALLYDAGSVYIFSDITAGITHTPNEKEITIYAADRTLYVVVDEPFNGLINVYNTIGELVITSSIQSDMNRLTIDSAGGIYIVQVTDGHKVVAYKRVVVVR